MKLVINIEKDLIYIYSYNSITIISWLQDIIINIC